MPNKDAKYASFPYMCKSIVTGEEVEKEMSEEGIDEGEKHCDADVTGKSVESDGARKTGEDEVEEDGDGGYCAALMSSHTCSRTRELSFSDPCRK